MNFDTTFNYQLCIDDTNSYLTAAQTSLNNLIAQRTLYQNVVGYSNITTPKITELDLSITNITDLINAKTDILAEVHAIQNLDSTIKDKLFYFYTIVGDSQPKLFMKKMLFNYTTALADPDIIALLGDGVNTSEAKTAIAKIVYAKYDINPVVSRYIYVI